jgi:hypothetical protein
LRVRAGAVRDTGRVTDVFAVVVFVVVAGMAIVAVITLAGARRSYDEIGHGGLSLRDGTDRGAADPLPAAAMREVEIRQLLEARNVRRARRGEPPLDVDAELERLSRETAPAGADPAIVAEVRSLVEARNARRVRKGEPPLDVEAEVARRVAELDAQAK